MFARHHADARGTGQLDGKGNQQPTANRKLTEPNRLQLG
jgi:hypothetical protein